MRNQLPQALACLVTLALAGAAHADMVGTLGSSPIAESTSVAFANSNVTAGTIGGNGTYNFLDQWQFTLNGSYQVSTIAASIAFTDPSGQSVLLGITNLQVNLVANPNPGTPIVSWESVTAPATGLEQTVALTPPTPLGAGSYTLEVRGDVTQPGSYSGSMIATPLSPVPLPGSGGLLVAGIGALVLLRQLARKSGSNHLAF